MGSACLELASMVMTTEVGSNKLRWKAVLKILFSVLFAFEKYDPITLGINHFFNFQNYKVLPKCYSNQCLRKQNQM